VTATEPPDGRSHPAVLHWLDLESVAVHPVLEVRRIHQWALLPEKRHVDRQPGREEAKHLDADFRYHRAFRRPEACPPWVMGQEAGWQLLAPISVTLNPIEDAQIGPDEDLTAAGRILGMTEFWRRGEGYLATKPASWLRAHQYRGTGDAWESMFVPNGQGSAEWHLGFAARIPESYLLLITGLDEPAGLDVPTGILTDRQVNRTWDGPGLSVAIRPTDTIRLQRGQPFARMLLLHRDSLQAKLVETT
jgi:hypothetical protein